MNRRSFLSTAGAAALTGAGCHRRSAQPADEGEPRRAAPSAEAHGKQARTVRMHVGCQRGPTTPEMLQFFKRHGVDHICGYPVIEDRRRGHWTVDELSRALGANQASIRLGGTRSISAANTNSGSNNGNSGNNNSGSGTNNGNGARKEAGQ